MRGEDRVARYAVVLALVTVVVAPIASWLGVPQVLAGAGIVAGLAARATGRRLVGTVAIVLGVLVLVFGILATALPPADAG